MNKGVRLALIAFLFASRAWMAFARDVIEVESQYTGGGCFVYTVRTLYDPLVKEIGFSDFAPMPFTNYVTNTVPPHWRSVSSSEWNGIMYTFDETNPPPRINEISFSVYSSSLGFRQETNGFFLSMYFMLADCFDFGSYVSHGAFVPCLLPCAPAESDGSASNLVSRLELLSDPKIEELILTNNEAYGLKYSWDTQSTVELQASHDLTNWTSVARFFGDPPETTWTTNSPITSYGEFFRLWLIACGRHDTNALGTVLPGRAVKKW
jgi:hypothetical protein